MTASITPLVPASPANLDDWKVALESQYLKTVKGILDFGLMVYQFKQWCAKKSGGSTFSERMKAWFEMTPPTASQWARIGEQYDKLFQSLKKLPAARSTIWLIASLPSEVIEDEITPELTYDDVLEIKKWHECGPQGPLPKPSWTLLKRALTDEVGRNNWADSALALGIDPKPYTTEALLEAACMERQIQKARAQHCSPEEVSVEPPPDGTDVEKRPELTALAAVLRLPLIERLRWCEQYGFNAAAVLGVPFGLAIATYVERYQSARRHLHDRYLTRQPFGSFDEQQVILQRALQELCGVASTVTTIDQADDHDDEQEAA